MTKKPSSTSSEWSFSFRTTNADFYSDSDSDTDSVNLDELRLINDLDLSSREETVLYKPNPFSIAKINAASRAQGTGTGTGVASRQEPGPTKEKTILKAKLATQPNLKGNIINGFKKQAERSKSQSLSVNALKPGMVAPRRCADEPTKPLTKVTNCPLPVKTAISTTHPKSVPLGTLFPKSKTAIRPGAGVQSSDAAVNQVSPAINIPPPPSMSSSSAAFAHESPHHPKLASSATQFSPTLEHTHILTQSQRTSTPVHQLVLPVPLPQSQDSQAPNPTSRLQQPEFQLGLLSSSPLPPHNGHSHHLQDNYHLLANNPVPLSLDARFTPTLASSSSPQSLMPRPARNLPISDDTPNVFAQSTTGLDKHKSKFRPQGGGPFSSPVLPPSRRFLPATLPQDHDNANARAFPRSSMSSMPFSSPIRPSNSYTYTHASTSAGAGAGSLPGSCAFSDTRVFPSRALDLSSSSRGRFPRSRPGLQAKPQLQPQSRLDPPFKYDSQHRSQPQIQMEHISPNIDGHGRQEDEYCALPLNGLDDEDDNDHHVYMHADSPNWTTPHNNALCSPIQALDAPLPNKSWTEQEQEYAMDVDCLDAVGGHQKQDNDYMRTPPGYQGSNASHSWSAVGAPPLTRYPKNEAWHSGFSAQACDDGCNRGQECASDSRVRNNTNTQTLKTRKREHSPSLPRSVSPSPPHKPNFNAKPKPNIGTSKISNLDAYAFKGLNRHEAQDEEWSTLPARKKAKTRTGIPALSDMRTTGKIKLPTALLARKGIGNDRKEELKTGMSATSARRVITFLPPPRHGAASFAGSGIGKKANPVSALKDGVLDQSQATPTKPVHKSTIYKSYPSPKRSALSPRSSPYRLQREGQSVPIPISTRSPPLRSRSRRGEVDNDYRPPSPPDSDPVVIPLTEGGCPSTSREDAGQAHEKEEDTDDVRNEGQDHESDVSMHIDITSIGQQYPVVKARMRECRRMEGQVWDLLGLPSCGRVYCAAEVDEVENGEKEMGIVVWTGRRT